MPVPTPTVKWDPDCDQLFRNEKEHQVVSWFRTHAAYFDPDGGSVQASDYDEALIMSVVKFLRELCFTLTRLKQEWSSWRIELHGSKSAAAHYRSPVECSNETSRTL